MTEQRTLGYGEGSGLQVDKYGHMFDSLYVSVTQIKFEFADGFRRYKLSSILLCLPCKPKFVFANMLAKNNYVDST
jgi:hypothetical protein